MIYRAWAEMPDKLVSLEEAISEIGDGSLLGLGGRTLHRAPMAAVREIVRQGLRGLGVVKTGAGGLDVDLLAGAGALSWAIFGSITLEPPFGLAPNFRRAIENGRLKPVEHTCYTMIMGLRASAFGVPFMPVGHIESDIVKTADLRRVVDPYTGREVLVVKAIRPDFAILHVHVADKRGNAIIKPPAHGAEDRLLAMAAEEVIITAEEVIDRITDQWAISIPGIYVDHVVEAPYGAHPTSMAPLYDVDEEHLRLYIEHCGNEEIFGRYLDRFVRCGHEEYLRLVGAM